MPETLKTRPGHHLPPIELETFKDSEPFVVAHLKQYIKMTAPSRNTGTNQLFLSYVQPHKPISTTTLTLKLVCNCNERVWNKSKHTWLTLN